MNLAKYLSKNKKYLLACSFGPDSMSLFHFLLSQGYVFEVAHVNYGLREEAKFETDQLEIYCHDNNIIIHTLFAKVDTKKNIEDECRKIRYNFFYKLNNNYSYDGVLVAHNEDDLLETYLLQKKRKIYANYFGIKDNITLFGVNIIRPLLSYKKSYLENYCKENNVPFAIDSSNLKDEFERNKIRHNIVSKMSDDERQMLLKEIKKKNDDNKKKIDYLQSINIHELNTLISLNDEYFILAINLILKEYDSSLSLSEKCSLEIKKILFSNKPNIVFNINDKVSFVKEYNKYKFVQNKKEVTYQFVITKKEIVDNEFFHFDLTSNLNKRNIKNFPICIRTYQTGDYLTIKDYTVPVRRLFIDWKMPLSLRKRWPIFTDKNGFVIYVPRYRSDFELSSSPDFYVKF